MRRTTPWNLLSITSIVSKLPRLDIRVIHGRPYHPQTQGKEERFHRTLKTEVLRGRYFDDLDHVQSRFDSWRDVYNHERPHEALKMDVPSSRYRVSLRTYSETLPPIEYAADLVVRKVNRVGRIRFRGTVYKMSEAFGGQSIGLRPTREDGVWQLFYCHQEIGRLDQRTGRVERSPRK